MGIGDRKLMKKLLYILIVVIFLTSLYYMPVKADSLDQNQATGAVGIGFGDSGSGRDYMCQGFKMATYNQITAVSFYPNSVGGGNVGFAVWIDNADANSNPLGAVASGLGGFTEIPAASVVTGSLNKYILTSNVTVTIGNQYTLCIAPWNTVTHAWSSSYNDFISSTANPYANGRRIHLDGSFANPTAPDSGNDDIQFSIYGQTVASPSAPMVTAGKFGKTVVKDKVVVNRGFDWAVQSVDVMKFSKDVICSQPSTSTVDTQLNLIVALKANYVSVSGFFDNPGCGDDVNLLNKWNTEARLKGLKVWWRMKDLSFEGDYSVTKATSSLGSIHQTAMRNWLSANQNLLQPGDIFTPFAEVQNGGISSVTYCGSTGLCQFPGPSEFNTFVRTIQADAQSRVPAGVAVGYWGFDAFIVAGIGNVDHVGTSYLEAATVNQTLPLTIDHYPEAISSTFAVDMPIIHSTMLTLVGYNVPIVLGEFGTITSTSTQGTVDVINNELPTLLHDRYVVGMNWWNLGPAGSEQLWDGVAITPAYNVLKKYFSR